MNSQHEHPTIKQESSPNQPEFDDISFAMEEFVAVKTESESESVSRYVREQSELYRQIMELVRSGCTEEQGYEGIEDIREIQPGVRGDIGHESSHALRELDHPVYYDGLSNVKFDGDTSPFDDDQSPIVVIPPSSERSSPLFESTTTTTPSPIPLPTVHMSPFTSCDSSRKSPGSSTPDCCVPHMSPAVDILQQAQLLPPFELGLSHSGMTVLSSEHPIQDQLLSKRTDIQQGNISPWIEGVQSPFNPSFEHVLDPWSQIQTPFTGMGSVSLHSHVPQQRIAGMNMSLPALYANSKNKDVSPTRGRPLQPRPLTCHVGYPDTPDSADWSTLPPTPALTACPTETEEPTPNSCALSRSSSISNVSRLAGGGIIFRGGLNCQQPQPPPLLPHVLQSSTSSSPNFDFTFRYTLSPSGSVPGPTSLGSNNSSSTPVKEKKHFCPEPDCPRRTRSFGSNADLQRHINMHMGYKPFPCDYEGCDKAYGQRNKLVKHALRDHGTLPQGATGRKRARTSLSRVAVLRTAG